MIYHYTDLNAAISIAKKGEVWLTDYRFLNDKEEFITGYEVLLEALDEYQDSEKKYPHGFTEDITRALEFIRGESFQQLERNNIFVASFSHVPDLLGQWRNYGKYCLELDSDFFRSEDVEVLDCHYLHHHGDALGYANALINTQILPNLLDVWRKDKCLISVELSCLLDIYALSFKHQAFNDESEVRFVFGCPSDDKRISFRARDDILIPYISVSFDRQLLKCITVGPLNNQSLALDSLSMFAESISREVQAELGSLDYVLAVNNSDIPYRDI